MKINPLWRAEQKNRLTITTLSLLMVGVLLSLRATPSVAAAANILIDNQVQYQTMTGWETTGRLWQFDKVNDQYNDEWEQHAAPIFNRMVNELGINRFRLEALSGMENPVDYWSPFVRREIGYTQFRKHYYEKINDNSDPFDTDLSGFQFGYFDYLVEKMLLPVKRLVEANGEKLYVNLNYVDFKWTTLSGNIEHATNPDEYAEFILACFVRLRDKYNVIPDALEIILEADNTRRWNGRNIGLGLLAAKKRLNDAGFYPDFIAPSTANASRAVEYFDAINTVPGAVEAMDTFAYHRYDNVVSKEMLEAIAQTASDWNLRTAMLEHVEADYAELMDDLIIGNASSWQQYGIATNRVEKKGGYYYNVENGGTNSPLIYLDSRARPFSLLFPHVRAGAVRVSADSDTDTIVPVAFVNENNTHVLAIQATIDAETFIKGLPDGQYQISHSTPDGIITRKGTTRINNSVVFPIEAETGLTTIVQVGAGLPVWINPDNHPTGSDTGGHKQNAIGSASLWLLILFALFRLRPSLPASGQPT